jgi:hypothetical protein
MKFVKRYVQVCLWAVLVPLPLLALHPEREPEVAVARGADASWVEPGVLSLSFRCPRSIDLGGETMIRIVPSVRREGRRTSYFPAVVYLSPAGRRYFERRQQYRPDASLAGAHVLVPEEETPGTSYSYCDTLAVGSLGNGALVLDYYYTDCCSDHLLLSDTVSVPLPPRTPCPPPVTAQASERIVPGPHRERVLLPLRFRVDRWEVEEGYMDNPECLSRLDSVLSPLLADSRRYRLDGLHVTGYASPEGPRDHNQTLSERRAESFSAWLCRRYRLEPERVSRSGGGEDWDGLRRMLDTDSLFSWRGEVLLLVRRYALSEVRKRKLQELDGGRAWRELLDRMYPYLRSMEVEIRYTVLPPEKEEGR